MARVEGNFRRGNAFFSQGLFLAARDAWEMAAAEIGPDTPPSVAVRVYNALGSLCLELRMLDEAFRHFNAARSLCEEAGAVHTALPGYARALNNLAVAHLRNGETDEALPLARKACELLRCQENESPLVAAIQLVIGVCLMNQEEWKEAAAAMQAALGVFARWGPRLYEIGCLNNLGIIAMEQGDTDHAFNMLETAMKLLADTHNVSLEAQVRSELGRLHFRQGDVQSALHHGSAALRMLWDNVGLLDRSEVARLCRLFGHIFALKGNRSLALSYLQRSTTYFAQSQMWREWAQATQELDQIIHNRTLAGTRVVVEHRDQEQLRYLTTLLGLMDTLESLYPESARTAELVTKYALILGEAAGLDQQRLARLSSAARLRDVGLTSDSGAGEEAQNGNHAVMSERVLAMLGVRAEILAAVRCHHENYDGTGVPDRLTATSIPLEARIIALAERYVKAVESELPQGPGYHSRAMSSLLRQAPHFDPDLLGLMAQMHRHNE